MEQPGWGERELSGKRCRSSADLRACVRLAVDYECHARVRSDAIGIFGVSLSGLLAPYCARLEPRFAAVAGSGARRVWPRPVATPSRH